MTCQLDMADVRGVILGINIVVREDAVCVEIVHEALVFEVVEDAHRFGLVDCGAAPAGSGADESAPLGLGGGLGVVVAV